MVVFEYVYIVKCILNSQVGVTALDIHRHRPTWIWIFRF